MACWSVTFLCVLTLMIRRDGVIYGILVLSKMYLSHRKMKLNELVQAKQ